MPRQDQRLPVGIVRDLLAITRTLYRSARAAGDLPQVQELEEIGKRLGLALELAQAKPGTLGHRAAWQHSEAALERLGGVVGSEATVTELLAAVADGLRKSAG